MKTREENYTQILKQMIDIPTISDRDLFNKEVFDKFHELLKELFPLVFKIFKYEEFNGSILLSYLINNNLDPILLMSHHDVVSVEDNWSFEPFNAEVVDGKIYGRGSLDTKCNLFAILESIEELLNEGHEFTRSIYIESSCNEETSGKGALEISRELKKRNVHFYFTLDEGGMIVYDPIGGADGYFAMIALGEKDYVDLKFTAISKGGHSSTPDKNNPIYRLSQFVVYVENHKLFKPYLQDTTIETFKCLSKKTKGILGFFLRHARFFKPILEKVMVKYSPTTASFVKTTICFCKAKGSEGFNVIPEEAYVTGNIRVSHKDSKDDVIEKFKKIAKKFSIDVEVLDYGHASPICDFKSEQYSLLTKLIREHFNDVISAPFISNGASDSKYFSDLSENNFRFAPFKVSNEQLDAMHAKDENIDVSTLVPAVDFYKDLIKKV